MCITCDYAFLTMADNVSPGVGLAYRRIGVNIDAMPSNVGTFLTNILYL